MRAGLSQFRHNRGRVQGKIRPFWLCEGKLSPESLNNLGFKLRRSQDRHTRPSRQAHHRLFRHGKQEGDSDIYSFSFLNKPQDREQVPCYLTYTTQKTHDIIRANLHRAPMYCGAIKGRGRGTAPASRTRWCALRDKERHQVFIEPEGAMTNEVYPSGREHFPPRGRAARDVQKHYRLGERQAHPLRLRHRV